MPSFARITPELATPGATSATSPPSAAVILPWFTTVAELLREAWSKTKFPAIAFSTEMPVVVATSPPTLTEAPWLNRMPLGLTSTTWPLALRCPEIVEGSTPVTRLTATEDGLGWWKFVVSPAPIENECQSSTARAEV